MKRVVAVLPAKGISSRLPGKNYKDLCGRPLVAWTILQLRCAKLVDDIYVSTDSDIIARISKAYGAKVLMREEAKESEEGAGYPMGRAIQRIQEIEPFDIMLACLCTSPLRKITDIDGIIDMYLKGDYYGIWTRARMQETMVLQPISKDKCEHIISDVDAQYLVNGNNITVISAELYQHISHLYYGHDCEFQGKAYPFYEIEEWQAHDIDTQEDFDIVETIFKRRLLDDWEEEWSAITGKGK